MSERDIVELLDELISDPIGDKTVSGLRSAKAEIEKWHAAAMDELRRRKNLGAEVASLRDRLAQAEGERDDWKRSANIQVENIRGWQELLEEVVLAFDNFEAIGNVGLKKVLSRVRAALPHLRHGGGPSEEKDE